MRVSWCGFLPWRAVFCPRGPVTPLGSRLPGLGRIFDHISATLTTTPRNGRDTMARPENRSEAQPLSLTLPEETFNYLVLLATLGKLGRTENEIATHILVREAYAMH